MIIQPLVCPFCGSDAKFIESEESLEGGTYGCVNTDCHLEVITFHRDSQAEGLKLWNTRSRSVREEELEKAVAQVRAATSDVEFEHRSLKLVDAALAMFPKEKSE